MTRVPISVQRHFLPFLLRNSQAILKSLCFIFQNVSNVNVVFCTFIITTSCWTSSNVGQKYTHFVFCNFAVNVRRNRCLQIMWSQNSDACETKRLCLQTTTISLISFSLYELKIKNINNYIK